MVFDTFGRIIMRICMSKTHFYNVSYAWNSILWCHQSNRKGIKKRTEMRSSDSTTRGRVPRTEQGRSLFFFCFFFCFVCLFSHKSCMVQKSWNIAHMNLTCSKYPFTCCNKMVQNVHHLQLFTK